MNKRLALTALSVAGLAAFGAAAFAAGKGATPKPVNHVAVAARTTTTLRITTTTRRRKHVVAPVTTVPVTLPPPTLPPVTYPPVTYPPVTYPPVTAPPVPAPEQLFRADMTRIYGKLGLVPRTIDLDTDFALAQAECVGFGVHGVDNEIRTQTDAAIAMEPVPGYTNYQWSTLSGATLGAAARNLCPQYWPAVQAYAIAHQPQG
jgi:hypothetical protein